jgi:hypothetical protein
MKRKSFAILPLATAIASLFGGTGANATPTTDLTPSPNAVSQEASAQTKLIPNTFFTSGEDLLGLLVTQQADGTVVAQHSSHYSHSSHSSHSSHASSRY